MWISLAQLFSILFTACKAIRITGLDVPTEALTGDEVRLRCDYENDESTSLYSLKWYKDGKEFYRHVPGNDQFQAKCPVQASAPGVTIDCWPSSEKEVVLKDITRNTSGDYRCEVIGDHPSFRREERKGRLTVYSEPLVSPEIRGAEVEYIMGSDVTLNCTSKNHEYIPNLAWFINGKPAYDDEIMYQYLSTPRSLGLHFKADQHRFIQGRVQVSCRATIGSSHVQSASKMLYIPKLLTSQYLSKGSRILLNQESFIFVTLISLIQAVK